MIKIDHSTIEYSQAISIVDQILEKHGRDIERMASGNKDGLIGVIHYSVKKSGAGNLFVRIWKD